MDQFNRLLFWATVFLLSVDLLFALSHFQRPGPGAADRDSPFTERFFTQTLDHFNFNSFGNGTFRQRYLVSDRWWQNGSGPFFFYTGNEGDIWEFARNSGFILELAAQQGALVVFAEHVRTLRLRRTAGVDVDGHPLTVCPHQRYYGASLPFGKDSFSGALVGLLTVEQALADFSALIAALKQQLQAPRCPVIVFGGSYGGMLAAYMRLKYPNMVSGALAASAPVLSTAGIGDRRQFFRDVTADFENVSPQCSAAVRAAFQQLRELAERQDYRQIQAQLALCQRPSSPQDVQQLNGLLRNAFTLMAMLDYPYSTHFMGNMPAHPVKLACDIMRRGPDLLGNLRDTAGIVYNSSASLSCFDPDQLFVECADPTGCGLGSNSLAWDYQACTEVELCFESNNVTDMFPPMSFGPAERLRYCQERWGVTPRPGWLHLQYWGDALSSASNIIFSNGDLDPWANGGVRHSLSSSLIAINISEGAHHLDLRAANEEDPPSVVQARRLEAQLIARWIRTETKGWSETTSD